MSELEIRGTFIGDDGLCHELGHACSGCCPDLIPASGERINERHMAVRFGDNKPKKVVLMDGADISMLAFEIMIGQDGWAYVRKLHGDGKPRLHGCGHRDLCAEVLRGSVMVAVR